jgi:hypothetical protein
MTRLSWYLLFSCLFSWGLLSLWAPSVSTEILLGMLAPLVFVLATKTAVERALAVDPVGLTAVMAGGFLLKMLVCGVYVVLVVGFFSFRAVPFAISFTAYFLTLYLVEAFHLRMLLRAGWAGNDVG